MAVLLFLGLIDVGFDARLRPCLCLWSVFDNVVGQIDGWVGG